MKSVQKEKLYLIDISSFIFRAFFAIRPLSTSKGLPVNAVYGVLTMLLNLIEKYKPDLMACVFDTPAPSFRKKIYDEYKSNRGAPPDDLIPQFEYIKKAVEVLGIHQIAAPGYEADDLIATLAVKYKNHEVVIVTGDKDLMQLVDERVTVLDTMKNIQYGIKEVIEKLGVEPKFVTDYLGLIGDSSDNIPGVEGIGPKTAVDLIKEYGSLEEILKSTQKMKPGKRRDTLENSHKIAILSKELATVKKDLVDEVSESTIDALKYPKSYNDNFYEFLSEMEFKQLIIKYQNKKNTQNTNDSSQRIEKKTNAINLNESNSSLENILNLTKDLKEIEIQVLTKGDFFQDLEIENLIFNINKNEINLKLEPKDLKVIFKKLIQNNVKFVGYNLKNLFKCLLKMEFQYKDLKIIALNSFDFMLAHYLVEPEEKHDFEFIRTKYGNGDILQNPYSMSDYSQIKQILMSELDNLSLTKLFTEMEMPLSLVLANIEKNGIHVEKTVLNSLSVEFSDEIKTLESEIFSEAGGEFNLNSPKQLSVVLFEKLKLPVISKTKTGYSTDAEVLHKLAKLHSVPDKIIRYRELAKLKSTYVDVLPQLIEKDGRVHAKFNQAVAATGRLSSSDPNLQNIPIKTNTGRKIRKAFSAESGKVFVGADYSQIELRIVAELSNDQNMLNAFLKDQDIHLATAAEILNKKVEEVTDQERSAAKAINFGLIYGKTAFGLSQELNISRHQAQSYIDAYFKKYSGVKKFMDDCIAKAHKDKFSLTFFGRKRNIKDIDNKNVGVRNNAERMAMNTPVQGTAADVIKKVMILVADCCEELEAKFILSVHDELVLEVPKKQAKFAMDKLKSVMEEIVPEFKVNLKVSIGEAVNWMEL